MRRAHVVQILLEDGIAEDGCIAVTQPRRVVRSQRSCIISFLQTSCSVPPCTAGERTSRAHSSGLG